LATRVHLEKFERLRGRRALDGSSGFVEVIGFSRNTSGTRSYMKACLEHRMSCSYTYVNGVGKSRRRGLEVSGELRPIEGCGFAANSPI
jgi:hypothetical protein